MTDPFLSASQPIDIGVATERLFQEIADSSDDPAARDGMTQVNAQMRMVRPYEDEYFPDRAAEYAALADSWRKRDLPTLHRLLTAYFARRQALVPELARRGSPSN